MHFLDNVYKVAIDSHQSQSKIYSQSQMTVHPLENLNHKLQTFSAEITSSWIIEAIEYKTA